MHLLSKTALAALLLGSTIATGALAAAPDSTGCPPGMHRADSEGGQQLATRKADSEGGNAAFATRKADSEGGNAAFATRKADSEGAQQLASAAPCK